MHPDSEVHTAETTNHCLPQVLAGPATDLENYSPDIWRSCTLAWSEPAWGPYMSRENPNQEPGASMKRPILPSATTTPLPLVLWMKVGVRASLGCSGFGFNILLPQSLE